MTSAGKEVCVKRKRKEFGSEFGDDIESAKRTLYDFAEHAEQGLVDNNTKPDSKADSERNSKEEVKEKESAASEEEEEEEEEEDEANETEGALLFDEEKFLTCPSFNTAELLEASKVILPSIEEPLRSFIVYDVEKKLEEGGFPVYKRYLDEREENKNNDEAEKFERLQQIIKDATINGDPRKYQRILFERAKTKNTIVNLGTGYGKTLIALMCIKHFSPAFKEGKQTLFLVPSVALAIQQSITLRANLPSYSIQTACFATSNSETSRKALATANVIVATHGAILDLLQHYADIFTISKFNLLVIDECHYATGNHTYSILMNKFYHATPKQDQPHVLGLTASPLINVKESHTDEQLDTMLNNLEKTLDSTLASVSGLVRDSDSNSGMLMKSAKERSVNFSSTNCGRHLPSADNLELHNCRYREFRQLNQLYQELGPLIITVYCRTLIKELSRNEYDQESNQQFNEALRHLGHLVDFCEQDVHTFPNNGRTDKLLALEELLCEEVEEHGGAETVGLVFVDRRITAMALHNYFIWRDEQDGKAKIPEAKYIRHKIPTDPCPKVQYCNHDEGDQFDDSADDPFLAFQNSPRKVMSNTQSLSTDNDSMDIFDDADVDETFSDAYTNDKLTETSFALGKESSSEVHRRNPIRTIVLVRHATQIFKSLCVARKITREEEREELEASWIHKDTKVKEVLSKLRRKQVNLLIATSVVEEGVDLQACSFVAVFDTLKTTKGYIQMKGRARQKNAKFFVFHNTTEEQAKSYLHLSSAQDLERRVHSFIDKKSKSDMLNSKKGGSSDSTSGEYEQAPSNAELAALEAGMYTVENGRVDLHSAKSLLNRYALSVPLDPFSRTSRESLFAHMPVYEENRVILPSHLPNHVRSVSLPEKYYDLPRKEKHRLVSLMGCVRLHSLGLLNGRLLPLTRKDMQAHVMGIATRKLESIIPQELSLDNYFNKVEQRQIFVYSIHQTSETFERYEKTFKGNDHRLALISFEAISIEIPAFTLYHKELGLVKSSLGKASAVTITKEQHSILEDIFVLLMEERWRRRSKNMYFRLKEMQEYSSVILPYLIGIVSADESLDWDLMKLLLYEWKRSEEERIDAVRKRPSTSTQTRLWSPIYDQHNSYIVFGPSPENCSAPFPFEREGVSNYQEYFQKFRNFRVSAGSALFEAQRLWSLPSNLPISEEALARENDDLETKTQHPIYDMCDELLSVKLSQEACLEPPLANTHIFLLCCMLPQFLFVYERYQNTSAFIQHCCIHLPTLGGLLSKIPLDKVAVCLTSRSCSFSDSYEKLEFFGDAVLKMVQTDTLIKSSELRQWTGFLHEGDLSTLRSAMGSNDRLEQVCKHLALQQFVMTSALARGEWLPCPMTYKEGTLPMDDAPTGKVYADIIEAILGLVFLECDFEMAMKVADELHVTLPWTEIQHSPSKYKGSQELLSAISSVTGYQKFDRNALAEEAITHPSALSTNVPSYQRLEWIGDAVLCIAVRLWIYKNFRDVSLGEMVTMEAALVSNETLAFLCVKYGLQHHLDHRDNSLPSRLEDYTWTLKEGNGLWGADPPKCISDMMEAIIGSVHCDGGFAAGHQAALKMMTPVLNVLLRAKKVNRKIVLKHPKKILQEMSGELMDVKISPEADFAITEEDTTVLFPNGKWRRASKHGNSFVGSISILGKTLVGLSDSSSSVGKNKTCALMVSTLNKNPELGDRIQLVRSRVESGRARYVRAMREKRRLEALGFLEEVFPDYSYNPVP